MLAHDVDHFNSRTMLATHNLANHFAEEIDILRSFPMTLFSVVTCLTTTKTTITSIIPCAPSFSRGQLALPATTTLAGDVHHFNSGTLCLQHTTLLTTSRRDRHIPLVSHNILFRRIMSDNYQNCYCIIPCIHCQAMSLLFQFRPSVFQSFAVECEGDN